MSYSIDKWDSVINKYNKLSPIIYFKPDSVFLEESRLNLNFLQIKISDTDSLYDNYNYIFATVDKSPVEGYYTMVLDTAFEKIPLKLGKFEINKKEYVPVKQTLSATEYETTPSPDHTRQNEEAYAKVMNAVKVIAVVTILASAAMVTMQGGGSAAAAATPATTTSTGSKLPLATVGFSAKSSSLSAGESSYKSISILDKTKEIIISVAIFLGIGYIISALFGVKPNLNFAV